MLRAELDAQNNQNSFKQIRIRKLMPCVSVRITIGATREQKAQLVKDITDSIIGMKPEQTHVVIQEVADEDWGFSGLLPDEWMVTQNREVAA